MASTSVALSHQPTLRGGAASFNDGGGLSACVAGAGAAGRWESLPTVAKRRRRPCRDGVAGPAGGRAGEAAHAS